MLSINAKEINTYLKLINDQNPIHAHIVPGQMIVQMALQSQRLQWTSYRVKYIETVDTIPNDFRKYRSYFKST